MSDKMSYHLPHRQKNLKNIFLDSDVYCSAIKNKFNLYKLIL